MAAGRKRGKEQTRAGKIPEPFVPIRRRYFASREYLDCKPFDAVRAWLDVVFLARVSDGIDEDTGFELQRGQFAWSVRQLAKRWGWPRMAVHRWIAEKIAAGQIAVAEPGPPRATAPTVYLLVNYDFWNGWIEGCVRLGRDLVQGVGTGEDSAQLITEQEDTDEKKMPLGHEFGTRSGTDYMNARVSRKNDLKNVSTEMTPTFLEAWAIYPKRPNNSRAAAWRQWQARMKADIDEAEMLAGTKAYAAHCRKTGKEGTEFVKMAQTFYGRDLHFRAALETAATPSPSIYDPVTGELTPEALKIMGYRQ